MAYPVGLIYISLIISATGFILQSWLWLLKLGQSLFKISPNPHHSTTRPLAHLRHLCAGLRSPSSFPILALDEFTCHQFHHVVSKHKTLNGPPSPTGSNPNLLSSAFSFQDFPSHSPNKAHSILLFNDSRDTSHLCTFSHGPSLPMMLPFSFSGDYCSTPRSNATSPNSARLWVAPVSSRSIWILAKSTRIILHCACLHISPSPGSDLIDT